jgi:hypothetical protein
MTRGAQQSRSIGACAAHKQPPDHSLRFGLSQIVEYVTRGSRDLVMRWCPGNSHMHCKSLSFERAERVA